MLTITRIAVGPFETNCYVAGLRDGNALVIDPGDDAGNIVNVVENRRLHVAAFLITHGHVDHINALEALWSRFRAPVAMPGADLERAFSAANQMPPYYPVPRRPKVIDLILNGGEFVNEGGFSFRVIATPGHSPGSVCFLFPEENILFSGDTLFQGSVGRTDLPGGNMNQLARSLCILAELPPETRVYAGHGPETTIGREIASNPFLRKRRMQNGE